MDDQRDRRGGVVDKANSAINTAKNLRSAVGLARTAATVGRTVTTAAATSEVWIPVVIIVVIVLIILFTLFILLGHGSGIALDSQGGQNGGSPPGGGPISNSTVSCPVPGGTISTPSYTADSSTGHCGSSYGTTDPPCAVPYSRRALSIDVPDISQAVLPTIEGKSVKWTFVNKHDLQIGDCASPGPTGCGKEFIFVNYLEGGKNWTLFIGHIGFTSMAMGQSYDSGTTVGNSATDHFHISIGKDIPNPETFPPGSTDARPGWLAADTDLGTCTTSGSGGNSCTQQYEGVGDCSVVNLSKYFDSDNALIASLICQSESGSDPLKLNDNCASNDYSVGLFQINAVAQCSGAYGNLSCDNLLDIQARNTCENNWYDPVQNITKAKQILTEWSGWTPWGTWLHSGRNPPVKDILTQCGINN